MKGELLHLGQPLKLGFIGGGLNSAVGNTHQIASKMDNRWTLVSGCFSKDKVINQETAGYYGINIERTYDQWQDFLENEKGNIDAVCILTPTSIHKDMVLTALHLGYAVICEKSMGATYQEAIEISNAVRINNSFLAVTYNYSGYPMLRELRQMIIEGKLGKVQQIHIEMPQEGFQRLDKNGKIPTPQNWRLQDGIIPTISLDLGVHLHHMIYFLSGEKPLEVVADQSTFGHFNQIVDNVLCIAKYTGNISCQIWYSKSALGHRNGLRVRVYGSHGSAEWFQMHPENLVYSDIQGRYTVLDRSEPSFLAGEPRYNRFKSGHPAGFIEAFANHYYDIADSLIQFKQCGSYRSPFIFNDILAKEGLEMLEAISISAANRTWVPIKSNSKTAQPVSFNVTDSKIYGRRG